MKTIDEEKEDFLAHYGVRGMKWGKTGAGQMGQSPNSFFNKPGVAKAIVLGSYGKKSAYTNPAALEQRKTAGKLRIAALLTAVGSTTISSLGAKSGNPAVMNGAAFLGSASALAASGLGIASLVKGATGAALETQSRKEQGI